MDEKTMFAVYAQYLVNGCDALDALVFVAEHHADPATAAEAGAAFDLAMRAPVVAEGIAIELALRRREERFANGTRR